jgi:catechol 2,3-dioxygenase-like lactoylglutathione lyase family enzyme
MPALDGVIETALYVDDLERSARFYQAVFGFEVIDAGERLCALSVADRHILLLFRKGASDRPAGRGPRRRWPVAPRLRDPRGGAAGVGGMVVPKGCGDRAPPGVGPGRSQPLLPRSRPTPPGVGNARDLAERLLEIDQSARSACLKVPAKVLPSLAPLRIRCSS